MLRFSGQTFFLMKNNLLLVFRCKETGQLPVHCGLQMPARDIRNCVWATGKRTRLSLGFMEDRFGIAMCVRFFAALGCGRIETIGILAGISLQMDRIFRTGSGNSSHISLAVTALSLCHGQQARGISMDTSDRQLRQLLWEAREMFRDPRHPLNDPLHLKHDEAVAALELIMAHGRRRRGSETPPNA